MHAKMKKLKAMIMVLMCTLTMVGASSCLVSVSKDNGRHNGWYKNPHNPHNPNHENNPAPNPQGKSKEKHKDNGHHQ